ncbi:MAG: ung [Gammaproteobacteria bacterium]|jgi:uracil-DNA glycosylase|nr:ung [Gammaproteobacteria bacterium]
MEDIKTWQTVIGEEKKQPYFQKVLAFVKEEQAKGKKIYPPSADIFNAFKYTPFEDLKVVILGQDPYHGEGQAHGLCFSVRPGITPPPSLKNIFLELHNDLGVPMPSHGNLEKWAKQGVLLLNTVLTVEAGKPQSHANQGWETFTDHVISVINKEKEGVIFLLWGSPAQRKGSIIDAKRHYILKAPHPSPLSAHRGFLGCKHFSKTNALLREMGKKEIDWDIENNNPSTPVKGSAS